MDTSPFTSLGQSSADIFVLRPTVRGPNCLNHGFGPDLAWEQAAIGKLTKELLSASRLRRNDHGPRLILDFEENEI